MIGRTGADASIEVETEVAGATGADGGGVATGETGRIAWSEGAVEVDVAIGDGRQARTIAWKQQKTRIASKTAVFRRAVGATDPQRCTQLADQRRSIAIVQYRTTAHTAIPQQMAQIRPNHAPRAVASLVQTGSTLTAAILAGLVGVDEHVGSGAGRGAGGVAEEGEGVAGCASGGDGLAG